MTVFHACALLLTMSFIITLSKYSYFDSVMVKFMINLTNRFHVAMCLFSNRSQMTSKCGKNKKVAQGNSFRSMSLMFLPHFDIFCDLLLKRCTATWSLFVKLILPLEFFSESFSKKK